jgi:hypothetical protein
MLRGGYRGASSGLATANRYAWAVVYQADHGGKDEHDNSDVTPLAPPPAATPTPPTKNPMIASLNPPTIDQNTSGCAFPNFNNCAILVPAIQTPPIAC